MIALWNLCLVIKWVCQRVCRRVYYFIDQLFPCIWCNDKSRCSLYLWCHWLCCNLHRKRSHSFIIFIGFKKFLIVLTSRRICIKMREGTSTTDMFRPTFSHWRCLVLLFDPEHWKIRKHVGHSRAIIDKTGWFLNTPLAQLTSLTACIWHIYLRQVIIVMREFMWQMTCLALLRKRFSGSTTG